MEQTLLDDIKFVSEISHDLYEKGVTSINPFDNTVHLTRELFMKSFKNYTFEPWDDSENYRGQMWAEMGGLKFYALVPADSEMKEAV